MDYLPIKRAIVSVTDKSGLGDLAAFLHSRGVELVSTGGTQKFLENLGLPVTRCTWSPASRKCSTAGSKPCTPISTGILADKDNPNTSKRSSTSASKPLTRSSSTSTTSKSRRSETRSQSRHRTNRHRRPTMLRAAAKNYHSVLVIPEPAAYEEVQAELEGYNLAAPLALRRKMAARTFELTSAYDAMIAKYLK